MLFVFYRVIPESVRWLVANKKYTEAECVLRKAAKFNGVSLPEDPFDVKKKSLTEIKGNAKASIKQCNIIDMFRTPKLRKRSFILFYSW